MSRCLQPTSVLFACAWAPIDATIDDVVVDGHGVSSFDVPCGCSDNGALVISSFDVLGRCMSMGLSGLAARFAVVSLIRLDVHYRYCCGCLAYPLLLSLPALCGSVFWQWLLQSRVIL